jgi:uncharacterized membrane protein
LGLILNLFDWYIISISWSIAFMIAVGIYLYTDSKAQRKADIQKPSLVKIVKDFTFTWILLGLLILYIVSVKIGSSIVFAAGNIIAEVILIIYLLRNSSKK